MRDQATIKAANIRKYAGPRRVVLPGPDDWLNDAILAQLEVNSHLKEILDHRDQVDGRRVKVLFDAVRRTVEIITDRNDVAAG